MQNDNNMLQLTIDNLNKIFMSKLLFYDYIYALWKNKMFCN